MAKVTSGLHHDRLLIAIEIIEKSFTDEIKDKLSGKKFNMMSAHLFNLKLKAAILIALNEKKQLFVKSQKYIIIIDGKNETKKNINKQVEKIKIEITEMIKKYNGMVQGLRKKPLANMIPTIQKKICNVTTKDAIFNGKDTIDGLEYGPENHSISLCSRKKKMQTDGHFLVIKENLIGLLDAYLNVDNIDLWKLSDNAGLIPKFPIKWKLVHQITNIMMIKCQGTPACNKMIKLHTLLSHLTFPERKKFRVKYVTLYLALIKAKYRDQTNIYYCKNMKCICASTGFLFTQREKKEDKDMVFCEKCNITHYVHLHQVKCSLCKYSFCSTCEQHPYHLDRVCYGVVPDDVKLLLLNSSSFKPCPGCKIPYEKSGGCDHIICGNIECKIHWCWRCLQKLDSKDPYFHTCLSAGAVGTNVDGAYRDFHVDVNDDDDIPDLIHGINFEDVQNPNLVLEHNFNPINIIRPHEQDGAVDVAVNIPNLNWIPINFFRPHGQDQELIVDLMRINGLRYDPRVADILPQQANEIIPHEIIISEPANFLTKIKLFYDRCATFILESIGIKPKNNVKKITFALVCGYIMLTYLDR